MNNLTILLHTLSQEKLDLLTDFATANGINLKFQGDQVNDLFEHSLVVVKPIFFGHPVFYYDTKRSSRCYLAFDSIEVERSPEFDKKIFDYFNHVYAGFAIALAIPDGRGYSGIIARLVSPYSDLVSKGYAVEIQEW